MPGTNQGKLKNLAKMKKMHILISRLHQVFYNKGIKGRIAQGWTPQGFANVFHYSGVQRSSIWCLSLFWSQGLLIRCLRALFCWHCLKWRYLFLELLIQSYLSSQLILFSQMLENWDQNHQELPFWFHLREFLIFMGFSRERIQMR